MGFFGLLIVGFLFVVFKLVSKSKSSYWKGEVIDKKHNQRRDFDNPKKMENFYHLVVKTEEGKEIKVGVSQKDFDSWKIGDEAEKRKGELRPCKV